VRRIAGSVRVIGKLIGLYGALAPGRTRSSYLVRGRPLARIATAPAATRGVAADLPLFRPSGRRVRDGYQGGGQLPAEVRARCRLVPLLSPLLSVLAGAATTACAG
jgi:hypothetical protein